MAYTARAPPADAWPASAQAAPSAASRAARSERGARYVLARQERDSPSLVEQAQDAVSWLSRAIADLDSGDHDAPAAIVDTLARVLVLYVFADVARNAATNEIIQRKHKHT